MANKTKNRQQEQQQLWFDFPNKDVSIGSSIGSTGINEIELNSQEEKEDFSGYHEDDHVVFDDDDDEDHDDRMKLVSLDNHRQGKSTRYEICEQCQLSSRSLGGANLNHCGSYDDAEFGQSAHEASIATHMLHCPHRHYDKELENEYYNNEGNGGSSNHFFTHFNIYGGRGGNTGINTTTLCCCYRRTLFVLATVGIIALTTTVFFGNTIHPTLSASSSSTTDTATSSNNNTSYYGSNGYDQKPQPQGTTVVVVPEAPAELMDACTYMNNDNNDNDNTVSQQSQEQTCIELCSVGSCCLLSGPKNCFASNPRTCQDYLLCPIDPTTNQPITTFVGGGISGGGGASASPLPAMEGLQELCSSTAIATEGGRDVCHELCIGGLCCIGQDGDCSSSQECQAYQPCHSIWSADGYSNNNNGIPTLPLNGLCSSTNLQTTKGQQECNKACQFGTCCFDGTCLDTHPLICDEYKFCPEYEHMVDSTTTHKQVVVPYPIQDLDVICNSDTPEGKQTCLEECLKGTCCFEEGEHQNCFSDNQETCEAYEMCVTVLPSTDSMLGTETVISPVEALCNVETILSSSNEGRQLCESICQYGNCCFSEEESLSCQRDHLDVCEAYRSCSLLKKVPEAPDNLAELCALGTHGNHECERICAVASCCVSSSDSKGQHGPCQPTNVDTCASYEGICHTSEGGSSADKSVVESEEISPLASICSDIHKLTSDEGRQQCHDECAPAKCCVALSKDESCYDTNREECDEYKLYCMDMWDVPQKEEQQVSVSPMSLICSKDAITTEEGRSKCVNECDHATCCDAESMAFNCYDSNQEWCDEVSIYCRILD